MIGIRITLQAHLVTNVGDHDWGDETDDKVHEPVGGTRDGHALGTHVEGL